MLPGPCLSTGALISCGKYSKSYNVCRQCVSLVTFMDVCLVPSKLLYSRIVCCRYMLQHPSCKCTLTVRRLAPVYTRPPYAAYTVHCKNIRISADILWQVFHILMEPVPYTFVPSVNRRNNEARAHIAMFTTNVPWIGAIAA